MLGGDPQGWYVSGMRYLVLLALSLFACSASSPQTSTSPPPAAADSSTGDPGTDAGNGGGDMDSANPGEPVSDQAAPFALVELFTSEGCSSCPPADVGINALVLKELGGTRRVFPIEWHVDYWDYLGWKDPYSSKDATDRQAAYAHAMNSATAYTPQALFDTTVYAGSFDSASIESAVAQALAKPVSVSTTVWLEGTRDDTPLTVHYRVENAPTSTTTKLLVVYVERGLVQDVTAGENAGVTLHHENVARTFTTLSPGNGQTALTPPADSRRDHASVIAFVQDTKTMSIVGATKLDL